jgi:hypothetical protein
MRDDLRPSWAAVVGLWLSAWLTLSAVAQGPAERVRTNTIGMTLWSVVPDLSMSER